MENIEIRLILPSDKDRLIDFLKYHIPQNGAPTYVSLRFTQDDIDYLARLKAYEALKQSDKPISYLAMDTTTDRIIAISTAYIVDPNDKSEIAEFESPSPVGPEMQKLIDFWQLMASGLEEFLPQDYRGPYMMGEIALVDPRYRKLGLSEKMFDLAHERGWTKFGCKYQFGVCVSYKTQKLCEKQKYTTVRWIRYEDYFVDGKRVFDFSPDSDYKYAKLLMGDVEYLAEIGKARSNSKL